MSLFYHAYFIKTQEPTTKLKEKFFRVDSIPESEWILCDLSNDYSDGIFEPGIYLTKEISLQFGEAIFICVDTSNDQLDYEHSKEGIILRKLCWLSDGCQSTWTWIEGEMEEWENNIIFSEENFDRTIETIKYDENLQLLSEEQFLQKQKELRSIWDERQYVLEENLPLGDATIGIAIQDFFGIKMPSYFEE
ncbi:MAG: hypothetical protein RMX68_027780 [Aulosira sp. ZfuVER01]|nr:hypothetical protein [Aulosira sp. ZfuVER01]MDZ8000677.1 hypothetical protein [Aulosira sp. DedVER01a]MDZ8051792.1 hypothetical protein [Aulosira sp. ZfuCHP01]